MDLHEAVVALEIGSAKTAALVARPDAKGRLEVVSLAYGPTLGFERWRIVDEQAVAESIDSVLGKLERHLGIPIERLYVGFATPEMESVTGQAMMPIFPAGRAVKRQDIHTLVQTSRRVTGGGEGEQVLALPRHFLVDGKKIFSPPEGLEAQRVEVETHILTCPVGEVDQIEKMLKAGKREVLGFVPTGLASGLGTLSVDGLELGATVIDIGAETTTMGVFMEGAFVYQVVLPVGSAYVSRDIMQLLSVEWDEAERLKCDEGNAWAESVEAHDRISVLQSGMSESRPMQKKVLAEIVESRMREIFSACRNRLEDFLPLEELPIMVVLTGGGSVVRGTEQLCEEILDGKRAKVAQPKVAGRFAGQVASPMLATIVGVARYALESDEAELAPISGSAGWRDRFRTLISRFDGKK